MYLLIHDLTTTSRNNIQRDAKIKALITMHHYFLIRNWCDAKYLNYDFPKIA